MSTTTTRYGATVPDLSQVDDIPSVLTTLIAPFDANSAQWVSASSPPAHTPSGGKLWWNPNTKELRYDDGAAHNDLIPKGTTVTNLPAVGTAGSAGGAVAVSRADHTHTLPAGIASSDLAKLQIRIGTAVLTTSGNAFDNYTGVPIPFTNPLPASCLGVWPALGDGQADLNINNTVGGIAIPIIGVYSSSTTGWIASVRWANGIAAAGQSLRITYVAIGQ